MSAPPVGSPDCPSVLSILCQHDLPAVGKLGCAAAIIESYAVLQFLALQKRFDALAQIVGPLI